MQHLLIVGAGATIEECHRSGNRPHDSNFDFPVIRNFCNKLFVPDSRILLQTTASYLQSKGIAFDTKRLNAKAGDVVMPDDLKNSPIGVFKELETQTPQDHNIERLCAYVWQVFGTDPDFWHQFVYDGMYFYLFMRFTEQFGLGEGRPMLAGRRIASILKPGDAVINLNYDIAFDLALKQAKKSIVYAPHYRKNTISILKPHGSFNLYADLKTGDCFFMDPDRIYGSVDIVENGRTWSPFIIVPPRLHKTYQQHPGAEQILNTGRPFSPKVVTFWGIGLTDSDVDLLTVYKEAVNRAKTVEFINPSVDAHQMAQRLLNRKIAHFPKLDDWFAKYRI